MLSSSQLCNVGLMCIVEALVVAAYVGHLDSEEDNQVEPEEEIRAVVVLVVDDQLAALG